MADGSSKELATEQGKEAALQALADRRKENAGKERISNGDLPAGSPMYYYCITCGDLADILPELWFITPPKKLCDECSAMQKLGWLE